MIALLLMISFVLHLVTLVAIYQLFKHLQSFKRETNVDAISNLFETYLEEIKAENRRLQNELITKQSHETSETGSRKPTLPETKGTDQTSIDLESAEVPSIDRHDSFEASLQAKVLQLDYQGFTVDEIARKLNCGKTEADLMIKLHMKNNGKA